MSNSITSSEALQYYVESPDEHLGYVDHFYVDELNWIIPAFRVSTDHALLKKHRIIPYTLVDRIDISSRRIFLKENLNPMSATSSHGTTVHFLHTTRDLMGFELRTPENSFGKIEDLIFNRSSWNVEDLVLKTHRVLGGKHVLIRSEQIQRVDWSNGEVLVNLHESEVIKATEFKSTDSHFQSTHLFG